MSESKQEVYFKVGDTNFNPGDDNYRGIALETTNGANVAINLGGSIISNNATPENPDPTEKQILIDGQPIGGGTEVIANPEITGEEDDLTALQVGETKYKVPSGGSGSNELTYISVEIDKEVVDEQTTYHISNEETGDDMSAEDLLDLLQDNTKKVSLYFVTYGDSDNQIEIRVDNPIIASPDSSFTYINGAGNYYDENYPNTFNPCQLYLTIDISGDEPHITDVDYTILSSAEHKYKLCFALGEDYYVTVPFPYLTITETDLSELIFPDTYREISNKAISLDGEPSQEALGELFTFLKTYIAEHYIPANQYQEGRLYMELMGNMACDDSGQYYIVTTPIIMNYTSGLDDVIYITYSAIKITDPTTNGDLTLTLTRDENNDVSVSLATDLFYNEVINNVVWLKEDEQIS